MTKPATDRRTSPLWVRLTMRERAALEVRCKANGESMSDAIRRAVSDPDDVARDIAELRAMCGDLTLRLREANRRAMRVLGLESENKKLRARIERMEGGNQ